MCENDIEVYASKQDCIRVYETEMGLKLLSSYVVMFFHKYESHQFIARVDFEKLKEQYEVWKVERRLKKYLELKKKCAVKSKKYLENVLEKAIKNSITESLLPGFKPKPTPKIASKTQVEDDDWVNPNIQGALG